MDGMRARRLIQRVSASEHAPVLLLFAVGLLVYGHLLWPGQTPYSPYSDMLPEHLATKDVLWQADGLPLWRRDAMLGAPALTDPQALYLHPLHAYFWVADPLAAVGPTLWLLFFFAGYGGYQLGRVLCCGRRAAALVGLSQLLCFKLIAVGHAGWLPVLPVLCLLPALAAAVLRLWLRPGLAPALLLGLWLMMALSGGSPQTLYYLGLCLLPCALLRHGAAPDEAGQEPIARLCRSLPLAVLAGLWGVLGTSYLWVPLVRDLPLLSRGDQGYDYFLSGHGLSLSHLATLLHPELLGTPLDRSYPGGELWEDVAYFGLLPLLGAGYALVQVRTASPLGRYLCGAFVASLLLSLESPLQESLFHVLPGYSTFRMPGRMLFLSALLGAALFGLSADRLLRSWRGPRSWIAFLGVALLMVVEGRVHAARYLTTVESETLRPANDHPVLSLAGKRDAGRVAVLGRSPFNYGWAAGAGLRLFNGYNPYSQAAFKRFADLATTGRTQPQPLSNWLDLQTIARPDLLREAGVTHVVSRVPIALSALSLVGEPRPARSFLFYKGFRSRDIHVYALREPYGLSRFATRVVPVRDDTEAVERMAAQPLTGQAYVLGAPAPRDTLSREGVLSVLHQTPGRIVLRVGRDTPGFVVVAESHHPDWQATIDGAPVPIRRTNLALMGLEVPAGQHRIELTFSPAGFHALLSLSLTAWLALLGSLAWLRLAGPTAQHPNRQV